MRIIKFRGKRVDNGEWVYGWYVKKWIQTRKNDGRFEHYIVNQVVDEEGQMWNESFEVIPETVGQFTGLTDKNGKDGYENDIVKVHWLAELGITEIDFEATGVIEYDIDFASFKINLLKPIRTTVAEDMHYECDELPLLKNDEDLTISWEVIDSAHDTPDTK